MRGIKLGKGDAVVDIVTVSANTTLLTACENGHGKRTAFDEYPAQGRGGQGVIDIKTEGRNGPVVALRDVQETDDVMMITSSGMVVRTAVREVSLIGRNTQGVRLIRLEESDRLVSVAPVAEEADDGSGDEGGEDDEADEVLEGDENGTDDAGGDEEGEADAGDDEGSGEESSEDEV